MEATVHPPLERPLEASEQEAYHLLAALEALEALEALGVVALEALEATAVQHLQRHVGES